MSLPPLLCQWKWLYSTFQPMHGALVHNAADTFKKRMFPRLTSVLLNSRLSPDEMSSVFRGQRSHAPRSVSPSIKHNNGYLNSNKTDTQRRNQDSNQDWNLISSCSTSILAGKTPSHTYRLDCGMMNHAEICKQKEKHCCKFVFNQNGHVHVFLCVLYIF